MVTLACLAIASTSLATASAVAAPPPNDLPAAPQALTLPANVRGATAEATLDADEPAASCAPGIKNSVSLSFTAAADRSVLAALDAGGEMDANIEVFQRQRSQVIPVACATTNRRGKATVDIDAASRRGLPDPRRAARELGHGGLLAARRRPRRAGAAARARASRAGASAPPRTASQIPTKCGPSASGPGARTGSTPSPRGAAARACRSTARARPGFGSPLKTLGCDRHLVYTPPDTGLYTLLVVAPRASSARLPYRLRVGRAQSDDSAPGLSLAEDRAVRGTLQGSELDALDLYRFAGRGAGRPPAAAPRPGPT